MKMNIVIYKTNTVTFLSMIEQALSDNEIPYTVTGAADIGIGSNRNIIVSVHESFEDQAVLIVKQIVE